MKILKVLLFLCIVTNLLFAISAVAPSAGDGTSGSPYQIASFENLYWVQQNTSTWDKYFIQTADIDASASSTLDGGAGWASIGIHSIKVFSGHYDGQGYVIDGLYANRPTATDYTGLFGQIWNSNSEIKNIHLTNMNITGNDYVGAIGGVVYAKINNCSSSGSISGDQRVGGLVGTTANSSPMNNCYSSAQVNGTRYVGGLVGSNESNMQKCYSTGVVTGDVYTGGIAGENYLTILNCYFTGRVSGNGQIGGLVGYNSSEIEDSYFSGSISGTTDVGGLVGSSDDMMGFPFVENCVWNTDTISTGIDAGMNFGTSYGKTTTEMKIQTTYTAITWDFTSVWSMDADTNNNYPYFPANPPSETALPITLTEFSAEPGNGTVVLSWNTASETDNACFLIYRDGDVIARLEGAGTSSEPHDYSYTDKQVVPGNTYAYVLADVSYANEETVHENFAVIVEMDENYQPMEFVLEANYPNPFNPVTEIPYTLASSEKVELNIYDINGMNVRTLVDRDQAGGYHKAVWDGKNNAGEAVNSGLYIAKIIAGDFIATQKMLFVK